MLFPAVPLYEGGNVLLLKTVSLCYRHGNRDSRTGIRLTLAEMTMRGSRDLLVLANNQSIQLANELHSSCLSVTVSSKPRACVGPAD